MTPAHHPASRASRSIAKAGEESPYRGLIPFGEDDADYFFGRENETERIIANLMASRLTLVYGASGVGKSSVLRAGVAHRLRAEARRNLERRGEAEFAVVSFASWRDDPVPQLARKIADTCTPLVPRNAEGIALPAEPTAFAELLEAWSRSIRGDLLIILDQFEEYFLYHEDADGPGSLLWELPRVLEKASLKASFVISIREDALARLDRFKGRIPRLFENYLRVDHLEADSARQAIVRPLELRARMRPGTGPVSVEPALVEEILKQVRTGRVSIDRDSRGVGTRPGVEGDHSLVEAPFLQLVLTRLWNEERAAGTPTLRLETLRRLGNADHIVRTHLDQAMGRLSPEDRAAAARVFHMLVTPSGTKIAHTVEDLAQYAGTTKEDLEPVLDKLAGPEIRILRPVAPPPDRAEAERYEIFHDVLAPAVLDWCRRYLSDRRAHEQVAEQIEATRARTQRRIVRIFSVATVILVLVLAGLLVSTLQTRRAMEGELKAERDRLAALNLAQGRTDRIVAGIQLKQRALADSTFFDVATVAPRMQEKTIDFSVRAKPSYMSGGTQYYHFEMFPSASKAALDSVAFITYKMNHPTFRNYLLLTGPARGFAATYDGWGCLRQVIAIIEYKNPDSLPTLRSFDMCEKLGW